MKTLISTFLFIFSMNLIAQPINKEILTANCNDYVLNPQKIKLNFNSELRYFQLGEVKVDIPESIGVKIKGCEKRLKVVGKFGDISKDIERVIRLSYPKVNAPKIKLHIRDIRVLYNMLPSSNPRLYVTIDFYTENFKKEYDLKYSTTGIEVITNFIERPLGRLIRSSIQDFHDEQRYRNSFVLMDQEGETDNTKGIYTSFTDFKSNKPLYNFNYQVKEDVNDSLKARYYILDENGKKLKTPFFAFNDGDKSFLNVNNYYPMDYYVEISKITDEYYFIYDAIYDYSADSNYVAVLGGGALVSLISSASTKVRSPGLIHRQTGELISYSRKELKNILGDKFEHYLNLKKTEDRKGIFELFKKLLSDEEIKPKLENL